MVYTESPLLLPKGSKICWNPLTSIVFRETKSDHRVMRRALWCGSGQTSIPGVRRGWPSSHVTWARLTAPTARPASASCDCQLCSVLPPVSQKQSHVPHTPQPPESRWVWKNTVREGYGGNRGVFTPLTRFPGWGCKERGVHQDKPSLTGFSF